MFLSHEAILIHQGMVFLKPISATEGLMLPYMFACFAVAVHILGSRECPISSEKIVLEPVFFNPTLLTSSFNIRDIIIGSG